MLVENPQDNRPDIWYFAILAQGITVIKIRVVAAAKKNSGKEEDVYEN